MRLVYRDLTGADLGRLHDLDRAEHVTTAFATEQGKLVRRTVDWDVPRWLDAPAGDHSYAHMIEFCRGHAASGAHIIGCFAPEDALVGVGVMTPAVEPGVAQLAFLHVSRTFRRHGIASELLERLATWAREGGAQELYVSSTPTGSAVGFYEAAGFHVTDRPIVALLELEPEDIHLRRPL